MKHLATLILLLVAYTITVAQAPLVKQWDKRYGGDNWDEFRNFQQTIDGGYILGGYSTSGSTGDKTQDTIGDFDYWIVKIDSLGNKQWDKNFGGTERGEFYVIRQTNDTGYIMGGLSKSGLGGDKSQASNGDKDYWVVKTDAVGNKQWDKSFGGSEREVLEFLQQTKDGGYILGGFSELGISGDKTQASWGDNDYWIVKIDAAGNKEWDKAYGGFASDYLFSLDQTNDGGYILGGHSNSEIGGDKTQASRGDSDYWIVKIDSAGNKQWDKVYGGAFYENFSSILQTNDGGYILGGTSSSHVSGDKTQPKWGGEDYWIVKLNSAGDKLWDRDFGGISNESDFGNIYLTFDNGYLISGTSHSPRSGDKSENNPYLTSQTWIIKTDSLGLKQWDKTMLTTDFDDYGWAIQTRDSCFAVADWTRAGSGADKTQASQGRSDYWIIKLCECKPKTVNINVNGDTLVVREAGVSYQWYLNNIPISGATDSVYISHNGGTYTVQTTDNHSCVATSNPVIISGIDNLTEEDMVSVYQLTGDSWQLTVGNNWVGSITEMFDANGRVVFQSQITNHKSEISPDVSKGVYLLRVSSAKGSVVRKLVRL